MKRICCKPLVHLIIILFLNISVVESAHSFTIGEEREVGEKLLYTVRTAFPLIDDPDVIQYLNSLGNEVLDVTGLQFFEYHFFVINDKEFNAFAAPSGLVFFYAGLIRSMNSEDELVSVLAHEIGHIAKRHLASRIEKGNVISTASIAVMLAAIALGGGAGSQALLTGSLAAGQTASLHYSRNDEEEADLLAYEWMKRLGRHPEGQQKMLETMRRVSRYRSEALPQYLLTHPNPENRLDYVQDLLQIDKSELVNYRKGDNFNFIRFKYRVQASSDDPRGFKEYLSSLISRTDSKDFQHIMAKYGLSQIARLENDFDRGKKLLDEVIAHYEERAILKTDMGVMLYDAGEYEQARAVLEKVLTVNGNDMYCAWYLAKTYQRLGRLDRARQLLLQVSYNLPEYSKCYFALGEIAAHKKNNILASLYLGKFYLYEGKLKLARFSLDSVMNTEAGDEAIQNQAKQLLALIDRLEDDG